MKTYTQEEDREYMQYLDWLKREPPNAYDEMCYWQQRENDMELTTLERLQHWDARLFDRVGIEYTAELIHNAANEMAAIRQLAEKHQYSCGDGCYENDKCFLCEVKTLLGIK